MADTGGVVLPSRSENRIPPTEHRKLIDSHAREMMELVPEELQSSPLNVSWSISQNPGLC